MAGVQPGRHVALLRAEAARSGDGEKITAAADRRGDGLANPGATHEGVEDVKTVAPLLAALCFAISPVSWAHQAKVNERLPVIGDAPDFTLTDQDGSPFALHDVRGKVVAMTFI